MGFSRQEYWHGLLFPSPVDHVLSELSIMPCPSWVALHGMAQFHWVSLSCVWSMWSDCLVFCGCGFQSVCPLMPSLSAYHLTWFSLTLNVGYLFMADTAKCSRCSLPWTWDISSQLCLCAIIAACTVEPPKTDGSWWRGLTQCGPLEKGIANHFSILALRTPWTIWKGKKIGHWKMNSPGCRCPICY